MYYISFRNFTLFFRKFILRMDALGQLSSLRGITKTLIIGNNWTPFSGFKVLNFKFALLIPSAMRGKKFIKNGYSEQKC